MTDENFLLLTKKKRLVYLVRTIDTIDYLTSIEDADAVEYQEEYDRLILLVDNEEPETPIDEKG